jgi:Helix-turn-helix domain
MQQPHLSVEQRQLALRLKARGWTLREIGPQVNCAFATVGRIAQRGSRRPARGDGWVPGPGRLTLADREEITVGLHAGESFTVIAARLGKAVSTVSREVAANGGRGGYRAWRAHRRARSCEEDPGRAWSAGAFAGRYSAIRPANARPVTRGASRSRPDRAGRSDPGQHRVPVLEGPDHALRPPGNRLAGLLGCSHVQSSFCLGS